MRKHPGSSHFLDTWKVAIIGRGSQGAQHLQKTGLYSTGARHLGESPPSNDEDNLRTVLVVIEAWFRGY